MNRVKSGALTALSLAAMLALAPVARAAAADPMLSDPRVADLGAASPSEVRTVSLSLALRNAAALEAFVAGLSDPASPNYRQFITPAQFAASYGQTPEAVAQALAFLRTQGFTVNRVEANRLLISITGTNAQLESTFGAAMHQYALDGATWTAPATPVVTPAALQGIVTGFGGLGAKVQWRSHSVRPPTAGALAGDVPGALQPQVSLPASGPGTYTVKDFAARYNANPLYAKGLTGAGRTIGILTLAGYAQSDVFAYWNALGLTTGPNRITDVLVDGGSTDRAGSTQAAETTLDIEQAGGIAPGAAIRVYQAPNSQTGLLDVFSAAINENKADVLSLSWGVPETLTASGYRTGMHALLLQAAAQGIPVIVAAGDNGAFDLANFYPYPRCTTALSVDYPSNDPLVLAAGGTTWPVTLSHAWGDVAVAAERPWGWDYLRDYIVTNYGKASYYAYYYTVGGGGGVSVQQPLPTYQQGVPGVATSAPAQALICGAGTAFSVIGTLPGGYAGRNLPDVSLNADPFTGYSIYLNGAWTSYGGGTSFVAPQLNGLLTLIASGLPDARLGEINPRLYALFKAKGYGAGSPFKPVTTGDNEYWKATARYNPATGLGTLDAAALAAARGVQ